MHHGQTPACYFYSAYSFCTPEHGGSHMDAPIHFAERGLTVDKIPVARLVSPAVVVDVREKAQGDRDYRVTAQDISGEEKARGAIPARAIVILRTGWAKRWPDRKAYFGDDNPTDAALDDLPPRGATIYALPMKIGGRLRRAGAGARGASWTVTSERSGLHMRTHYKDGEGCSEHRLHQMVVIR